MGERITGTVTERKGWKLLDNSRVYTVTLIVSKQAWESVEEGDKLSIELPFEWER